MRGVAASGSPRYSARSTREHSRTERDQVRVAEVGERAELALELINFVDVRVVDRL
jgi:hypothetical protein